MIFLCTHGLIPPPKRSWVLSLSLSPLMIPSINIVPVIDNVFCMLNVPPVFRGWRYMTKISMASQIPHIPEKHKNADCQLSVSWLYSFKLFEVLFWLKITKNMVGSHQRPLLLCLICLSNYATDKYGSLTSIPLTYRISQLLL